MTQQPLGPPPIDPMSDVSWARVEREVWSRLDTEASGAIRRVSPPRRTGVYLGAAVAAAATVAIIVAATRSSESSESRETAREDEIARVVTAASPSMVAFGDIELTAAEDTAVVFDRDPKKPSAMVEHGAAWFEVAPRNGRARFVVRAGDATVEVIGTRFRVARAGEHVEVEVDRGVVGVTYHGTVVQLVAHDHWSSDPVAIAPPPPSPPSPPSPPTPPTPPTPIVVAPKPQRPTTEADRARFEQLSALEVHDPATAITGYLELASHTSSWSELALFAAGRLAFDRGDPRAAKLLDTYVSRFPDGANATDARHLLARLKSHP